MSKKELEFLDFFETILKLTKEKIKPGLYKTGRKPYSLTNIFAVKIVKMFYAFSTITKTLEFIKSNPNIREITGIEKVPSISVISQKKKELIRLIDFNEIQEKLIKEFYKDKIIGHLSIDSTIISSHEKAFKKEKKNKKKRGRKKINSQDEKDLIREKKKELKLDYCCKYGNYNRFLKKLNKKCSKTCKKNSKGDKEYYIGYKIHLAVDDNGIPISSIITGANVSDYKPAIPLIRMSNERVRFLYVLMDKGYDSQEIENATKRIDSIPIIDPKTKRNGFKKEMDPCYRERYKIRTTVERANGELKECFLSNKLYSRGKDAIFDINIAVLLYSLKKIKWRLQREAKTSKKLVA